MHLIARSLLLIAVLSPLSVAAFNEEQGYDQCILSALRGSRNPTATGFMRNACDQLYRNWAMLLPRDRAYHTCILESLGGVKDTSAVQQLVAACSRRSEGARPTFK
ncbi:VF_A0006 family four-cysteine protein [Burkholderia thailandensis]|uniref:VF_A0006 family four-cysteine protein n=1 Tax=Burkholderia thailandensis TaxID=57975 RepID=UPI0003EC8333|nr:VF_A0006 family four-cysteine protein [Burkholderia thailandensis]AHI63050.1 hypothetical protein BTL_450 [Burkholderia thailandensis H0587]AOJ49518.1 hypothetical protein AQ475_00800 [Burkholderia thailandensis]AVR24891.1 hypothetical protein A8H32_06925 [Burkholderia thailandensis]MCZ2896348.1 hypothetical protein [Burkholderia thailandensis]MCZ2903406.1 hypothetical protein [Burkholderia thailandensis]